MTHPVVQSHKFFLGLNCFVAMIFCLLSFFNTVAVSQDLKPDMSLKFYVFSWRSACREEINDVSEGVKDEVRGKG